MINSTNTEFGGTHESELAYVLSKFNNDFIYNTVNESLANKLRVYDYEAPNIVIAFEQNFVLVKEEFPGNTDEITYVRNETYSNIIKILCDHYQLAINIDDDTDLFNITSVLYSLLVSSFQKSIVTFFVNFINKEKVSIYEMLQLYNKKKNKDNSMLYSKKIFKDQILGIITANLEYVINSICSGFDISLDTYLSCVYQDNYEMYTLLTSILSPVNNFFRTYISSVFLSEFRSILITAIRLEMHKTSDINNYSNIVESEMA